MLLPREEKQGNFYKNEEEKNQNMYFFLICDTYLLSNTHCQFVFNVLIEYILTHLYNNTSAIF